ncbi:ATP-binding cassette domain-containing protein [Streptomyces sp. NBC_00271]|uniref:ATP-binding cassette domain-containing protein n=1 Tax=Streptomyces sp. NBC_00271 TaxID=2975697 RepID=UPI002E28E942|nr:ATP-binding cassette domain-containing protein [Streptomyces sp. NBC_00271]
MSGGSGIRFDRVSVAYDGTTVLDSLDLTVEPGEVMALLGPSGSGKTTALRAVAGFVRPASGRVFIGDRDVTALPPHRRGVGMVVQQYALFPHMRVEDNVAFGLRAQKVAKGEIRGRVAEALEMTGMAAYARRHPRELSGGQQQRVAIARALAIRPGVLLLDEPLSALDAQLRSGMLAELSRLHRELPDMSILYDKATDAAGKPTTFALPYAAGLVTKAPHSENGRKLLDFMLSAKAQQQVSEIGGGFSARKDVKATDANAIALTKLMDGVALFEPDWADIDKNLTSYVEDWKTATGS